jgi:glutamate carboxypeptidase
VCDEEWRIGPFTHVERFAGYDACLCFEGGQRAEDGREQVIVKRKAAATVHVTATGRSAHSGSAPHRGINALLALAGAAQVLAGRHDPDGAERLTVVPTVIRSGDAFNVVPDSGELVADVRADTLDALRAVVGAVPPEIGGARLDTTLMREWPGMDSRDATAGLLEQASAAIGRPIVGARRGGASDASHFAPSIPLTVDGLGPLGGGAHAPHEFILESGVRPRAEVALALVDAVLAS